MDRLMWQLAVTFRLHTRLKGVPDLESDPNGCDDACDGSGG